MSGEVYKKVSSETVETERSTCGFRRRLLKKADGVPASVTRLKTNDATPHWHAHTHEYYYVLQGSGKLVINGEDVPVTDGDCVWIKPRAFHHAEGDLESLIIAVPAFDPSDMFLEKPASTPRPPVEAR